MNSVIMHINYCEIGFGSFGKSIDDVCRKASQWGFDGIEFRGRVPYDIESSLEEYMERIADGKKKYGLKEILFGYWVKGISSSESEVREKAIRDAVHFFKLAKEKCGTTICNVFADEIRSNYPGVCPTNYNYHGSAVATEKEWNLTVEGFKKIGAEVEKLGMQIAFETHMNYIHDTPQSCRKLVDLIDCPAVGLNMDCGNTVYFSNVPTPADVVKLYNDKIFYVHLKNSVSIGGVRHPTALAEGEINHRLYLKALKESGFEGPIAIEAPRSGDREWFVRQDMAYFKDVVKDIWSE